MTLRRTLEETEALVQVAQGRAKADLYLRGGRVVNVYSGEVLPANIAVWGRRIAYVGALDTMIGPETEMVDAEGYYVLPGLIEPHGHVDYFFTTTELARAVLPGGTTTVFGDCLPTYSLLDQPGFEAFLEEVGKLPVKFFFGARAEPPTFWDPQREDLFTDERLEWQLGLPEILGMAEYTPWFRTLSEEPLVRKLQTVRAAGKLVDGHLAGCSYEKLNPIIDAGVLACHEAINAEQALDRLRLGLWVILRESSIRHDLKDLVRLITEHKVDTSRLMLTPDGPVPMSILQDGFMDHLVRLAISYGVDPVTAIQMATINPATYLGLDQDLGGIAPGRIADMVLVKDLNEPRAEVVIANGKIRARNGMVLGEWPALDCYQGTRNKYRDPSSPFRDLQPSQFRPPVAGAPDLFPVIELVNGVITRRRDVPWRNQGGFVAIAQHEEALRVSLIVWDGRRIINGYLAGMGARFGGLASTVNTAKELLVMGESEFDMALAARTAIEMGGGIVLAEGGKVLYQLAYPIGGLFPLAPLTETAPVLASIENLLRERGFPFPSLYYTFHFLPTSHLIEIRLTVKGIWDVRKQQPIYEGQTVQ